jgi:hypothetical protein
MHMSAVWFPCCWLDFESVGLQFSRHHPKAFDCRFAGCGALLQRWSRVLITASLFTVLFDPAVARPQEVAGHATQTRTGAPTVARTHSLSIKPASIVLLQGEPQRLRLLDENGNAVRNARWAASAPDSAEVRVDGDAWITGLKPGKFTVVATWNELSAKAKVTVLGSVDTSEVFSPRMPSSSPSMPSPSPREPTQSASPSGSPPFDITPYIVNMLVGETHRLRLWDNERNRPVTDAIWTVSDPSIASIESGSDATVTALVPGKVTVTATWQGYQAEALVTVYPGTQLPPGTVKWSVRVSSAGAIRPAVPN